MSFISNIKQSAKQNKTKKERTEKYIPASASPSIAR